MASAIGCAVELWAASEPYAPGEVLVRFRDGIFTESGDVERHEAGVVRAALEAAKVRLVRWYPSVKVHRARLAGARSVEEAVAASTANDALAFFSNYGVQSVHVAAPGVNIVGTAPGDGYETGSGTSAATAFVSGAAALVLSRNPSMTPSEVKHRLLRTADVSPLLDKILSRGRLNVFRALTEAPSGPFIYRIIPEKAPHGAWVTLRGAAFGSTSGAVVFAGNVQGEVAFWSDEKIVVTVPQGALSGDVRVRSAQGESPPVWFEVSEAPPGVALRFAEVRAEAGQKPLLILSNPTDQPAFVTVRLMESTTQDLTLKTLTLSPRQKRFLWLEDLVPSTPPPSLLVECLAETFVGAAVVSVTDDYQRLIAFPPMVKW